MIERLTMEEVFQWRLHLYHYKSHRGYRGCTNLIRSLMYRTQSEFSLSCYGERSTSIRGCPLTLESYDSASPLGWGHTLNQDGLEQLMSEWSERLPRPWLIHEGLVLIIHLISTSFQGVPHRIGYVDH